MGWGGLEGGRDGKGQVLSQWSHTRSIVLEPGFAQDQCPQLQVGVVLHVLLPSVQAPKCSHLGDVASLVRRKEGQGGLVVDAPPLAGPLQGLGIPPACNIRIIIVLLLLVPGRCLAV